MAEIKGDYKKFLGRAVNVTVNPKLGSRVHSVGGTSYSLSFGNINDCPDDMMSDCYIMGLSESTDNFTGVIIAAAVREDGRDKFVVAPKGTEFYEPEILDTIGFAEKNFHSFLDCYYEKTCGIVLYTRILGNIKFLLIENIPSGHIGFPKGHIEFNESEIDTAQREVFEETRIAAVVKSKARSEYSYITSNGKHKRCVYFMSEYRHQPVTVQADEVSNCWLLSYHEAIRKLNYPYDKMVLIEMWDEINRSTNTFFDTPMRRVRIETTSPINSL